MIYAKKEYDFVYTEKYGKEIDEIILVLTKEYPEVFRDIRCKGLIFPVTALIIHAINYSRQMSPGKKK
jgi:hypothetical protein